MARVKQYLLPRREEIVYIVRDHPYCSLDLIARRFPGVSKRTIAYDVHHLAQAGYLKKHGATRGVRYSATDKLASDNSQK